MLVQGLWSSPACVANLCNWLQPLKRCRRRASLSSRSKQVKQWHFWAVGWKKQGLDHHQESRTASWDCLSRLIFCSGVVWINVLCALSAGLSWLQPLFWSTLAAKRHSAMAWQDDNRPLQLKTATG
jgi:hypothetical protein